MIERFICIATFVKVNEMAKRRTDWSDTKVFYEPHYRRRIRAWRVLTGTAWIAPLRQKGRWNCPFRIIAIFIFAIFIIFQETLNLLFYIDHPVYCH